MNSIDLHRLCESKTELSVLNSIPKDRQLSEVEIEELMSVLEDFMGWDHPDFVVVVGPRVEGFILFEKNYGLDFGDLPANSKSIVESILPEQIEALHQIDHTSLKFALSNQMSPKEFLFELKFNTELIPGKVITLLRKVIVLSTDENGLPDLAIMSVEDISSISRTQEIVFQVKSEKKGLNQKWLRDLNREVDKILKSNTKLLLSPREIEILIEIGLGLTSSEIAEKLNLAKSTVDTHRQNMIRKLKVSNSAGLLQKAQELGLL